jgi:hypothetical protein
MDERGFEDDQLTQKRWRGGGQGRGRGAGRLDRFPTSNLTTEQKESLSYMWQEEKVARDVYITLGEKYGLRVFQNISRSEQRHMDAIKNLLVRYNLPLPTQSDDVGVFKDQEFTNLFNDLVKRGNRSRAEAIEVGVDIEELDIADLEERIEDAPEDIAFVFGNLLRASYKHLAAFKRWR